MLVSKRKTWENKLHPDLNDFDDQKGLVFLRISTWWVDPIPGVSIWGRARRKRQAQLTPECVERSQWHNCVWPLRILLTPAPFSAQNIRYILILHMVVVATKTAHPGGKSSELDQHEDVGRGQVDKREKSLQIRKWKWFNLKIEHRKWKW